MEEDQSKIIQEMKEYKSRLLEKKAIYNDMKPKLDRIKNLNKQMHDIESKILVYMHDKGHEAIRFDDCLFKIKKIKNSRPSSKVLKENLKQLLNNPSTHIDPILYSQLTNLFDSHIPSPKESIDCVIPLNNHTKQTTV